MPALTRGPLPARVYWVRRLLVLGTATLLVVAIARLLGGGSDAASDPGAGAQLVADGSPTAALTDQPTATESARKPGKRASKSQEPVLAQPDGPCANDDVAITPKVENAVAGRDVRVVLQLRTLTAEACTWRVSRDSVTVNITSGKDRIWTSRDCPAAIEPRDVIIRKAVTTNVPLVWTQAKRSAEGCTRYTGWAMPGWYHVTAAPLGGEPSDLQFELTTPVAGTITKTVTPSQTPSQKPSQKPGQSASGRPVTPGQGSSHSPSGAVEPH